MTLPLMCPASQRRYLVLAGFVSFVGLGLGTGCRVRDQALTAPFSDDFQRSELGSDWNATAPNYHISDGRLTVANAYNHPAWLRKKLPRNAAIELDAMSKSPAGDLKVELYGDGESFDPDKGGYVSTGYVLIFGGWRNSLSVICRNNEHDDGRKAERATPRVELGRTYHWSITRKDGAIDWRIDGQPFLAWADPEPLAGPGHEYLAVDDWEAEVFFDNFQIRPLP